jgi:hypothetical protein
MTASAEAVRLVDRLWRALEVGHDNDGVDISEKAARSALLTYIGELERALERLSTSAALLQQNSVGCAVKHYGHDIELFGLPGWLQDTKQDIDAVRALLKSPGETS